MRPGHCSAWSYPAGPLARTFPSSQESTMSTIRLSCFMFHARPSQSIRTGIWLTWRRARKCLPKSDHRHGGTHPKLGQAPQHPPASGRCRGQVDLVDDLTAADVERASQLQHYRQGRHALPPLQAPQIAPLDVGGQGQALLRYVSNDSCITDDATKSGRNFGIEGLGTRRSAGGLVGSFLYRSNRHPGEGCLAALFIPRYI